jgi:hypothetical protein
MRKHESRQIFNNLEDINQDLAGVLGVTNQFIEEFQPRIYDTITDIQSHNLPLAKIGLRHLASPSARAQTHPSHTITSIPVSYDKQKEQLTKSLYKSVAASQIIAENKEFYTNSAERKSTAKLIATLVRQILQTTIEYPGAIFTQEELPTQYQIMAVNSLSSFLEYRKYSSTLDLLDEYVRAYDSLPTGSPEGWSNTLSDIYLKKDTKHRV